MIVTMVTLEYPHFAMIVKCRFTPVPFLIQNQICSVDE